jgi:hypothetical protein
MQEEANLVKSKNGKSNKELKNETVLTNETETTQFNKSIPAQQDGFRYDYNDSSEFNDDKMS